MALIGSRPLSTWFGIPVELEEGSPIERAVYSGLIFAGLIILFQRRSKFSISGLVTANGPLVLLLGYFGSFIWLALGALCQLLWGGRARAQSTALVALLALMFIWLLRPALYGGF